MTFVPRAYEDIVRDLLTTLTGGTVRETVTAPPEGERLVPEKLRRRPVRRISHLQGFVPYPPGGVVPAGADPRGIPYKFTAADFELVSSSGSETELDTIRFRADGRRPASSTPLTVNYYPVQTDPVPLTDLNVGSVTRTLVETMGREMALSHLALEQVYKSAFLETAEGSSLDKVVGLVGVARLPAGHPVTRAQFSRRPGTPGRITVPAGTALTDAAGNRYLTLDALTMEPNESAREVLAGGETVATQEVEAGKLDRLEVLIAGISAVTNPQPSRRPSAPETDPDLRRRARSALHGVVRGTLDALRFALLSVPGVRDVTLQEEPNGVPGEIRVTVAYSDDSQTVRAAVARTLDEVRPAGIRVVTGDAARRRLNVRAELTLAGAGVPGPEAAALTAAVENRLAEFLTRVSPGGKVRRSQLGTLALQDARIVDARIVLLPDGQGESEELQLAPNETLDLVRPFTFATAPEQQVAGPPVTSTVSAALSVHLMPGVTQADATAAINQALASHLTTRGPGAPLTVDGVAAAIRDDTRYALVRAEALVTVETAAGQFQQLTDGVGSYSPAANETLQKGTATVDVREGGA